MSLERAISADPENLKLAAEYRQQNIRAGEFDRSIRLLEPLANRKGSGPNVQISLALAYVDKVPTSGDIRRLYLGRDAMNALTKAIEQRPTPLAYYVRGLINLYYNNFIFHRVPRGVADLERAKSMLGDRAPAGLIRRVYLALGDGYFRLDDLAKARAAWSAGNARAPDRAFEARLAAEGQPLRDMVTAALYAGRRVDTSLVDLIPES
jgi:tetratricopeptide (TPR) repeat protein